MIYKLSVVKCGANFDDKLRKLEVFAEVSCL